MYLYLDVETTGLEESDRICSIGMIAVNSTGVVCHSENIKPPYKVSTEAMAVHHITNDMLKTAPSFEKSETAQLLETYNDEETILIAHNLNFDLSMLAKEGVIWRGGMIDTLKCSKHLIEEIDTFSLQYLRYELQLYKTEVEKAEELNVTLREHTALSDTFHVKMLHEYLLDLQGNEILMRMTTEPVLLQKFGFGKYKGRYVEEVVSIDEAYVRWLLAQEIDENLHYTLSYYL